MSRINAMAWQRDRWMVWAPDRQEPERLMIGHCTPDVAAMDFAIRLGRLLNRHVAEDGTWLVAWTDPRADGTPTRLAFGWVDRDGDMPFTVDTEESLAVLTRAGPEHYARSGQEALAEYREHLKAIEVAPRQMIRRSLGEHPRDPRQRVPWDFG